jgi:peroxiredoxin Q/BCP
MVMELRKRKAPPPPAAPSKKPTKATKAAPKAKETKEKVKEKAAEVAASTNGSSDAPKADAPKPAVGDTITLDGFGGEVTLNDGTTTTLKALVDESKAGVALFTYPKASTPGCKPSTPPPTQPPPPQNYNKPPPPPPPKPTG